MGVGRWGATCGSAQALDSRQPRPHGAPPSPLALATHPSPCDARASPRDASVNQIRVQILWPQPPLLHHAWWGGRGGGALWGGGGGGALPQRAPPPPTHTPQNHTCPLTWPEVFEQHFAARRQRAHHPPPLLTVHVHGDAAAVAPLRVGGGWVCVGVAGVGGCAGGWDGASKGGGQPGRCCCCCCCCCDAAFVPPHSTQHRTHIGAPPERGASVVQLAQVAQRVPPPRRLNLDDWGGRGGGRGGWKRELSPPPRPACAPHRNNRPPAPPRPAPPCAAHRPRQSMPAPRRKSCLPPLDPGPAP